MRAGLGVPARAPDDRHGRRGIGNQRHQRLHRIGAGRLGRTFDPRARHRGGVPAEHVFGQGQHDRAGPPRDRGGIGARDIFGDALGGIDPCRPFGDRSEERREVDFLEAFAVAHFTIHIADEQNHRLRILHRDMHADAGIGRPRTARDEGDAGAARHRAIGAGHE